MSLVEQHDSYSIGGSSLTRPGIISWARPSIGKISGEGRRGGGGEREGLVTLNTVFTRLDAAATIYFVM